jgi:putative two-component system response regulator
METAVLSDWTTTRNSCPSEGDTQAAPPPSRTVPVSEATIMIVDDEPINIKAVQKYLQLAGYDRFVTTTNPRETLDLIRQHRPDVIVLDIVMPEFSGLQILEAIRGDSDLCHLPVLILTAATDGKTKQEALDLGATDFLPKPLQPQELLARMRNALVVKAHHDHLAKYSARLEQEVRQRTEQLEQSRREVIHVLACAAELRDHDTYNHVLRVGRFVGLIARQLGLPNGEVELLEQAAVLHDVGKIGIADAILRKPGKLSAQERDVMQTHCELGMSILRGRPSPESGRPRESAEIKRTTDSPVLKLAAVIAMSHHEKWDGTGYPLGLKGQGIPIEGRITAVADVFDALLSWRPYKSPLSLDLALDIVEEGRGKHFDPAVLDAFFARLDEIVRISLELAD